MLIPFECQTSVESVSERWYWDSRIKREKITYSYPHGVKNHEKWKVFSYHGLVLAIRFRISLDLGMVAMSNITIVRNYPHKTDVLKIYYETAVWNNLPSSPNVTEDRQHCHIRLHLRCLFPIYFTIKFPCLRYIWIVSDSYDIVL